jgi:hypothetical protein
LHILRTVSSVINLKFGFRINLRGGGGGAVEVRTLSHQLNLGVVINGIVGNRGTPGHVRQLCSVGRKCNLLRYLLLQYEPEFISSAVAL